MGTNMRAVISASCLVLALAGQQKPSDLYASAIAKYVAGDTDAAFDALARAPHADIQKVVGSVAAVMANGGSTAARRRLEAIAMLHTDYGLLGGLQPNDVNFHIDMAHLALSVARMTLAGKDPANTTQGTDRTSGVVLQSESTRALEFVPRWTALATSVLLTYGSDQQAETLVNESLKLLPDNEEVLFWRAGVMEFQAVWVGVPSANVRAAVPGMNSRDGSGYDMLTNTRTWAPVEEAYRHALARRPDDFEAHLHLGYSLYSLRSYAAAKTELELARDKSADPFVVYVADLLLARVKEDENDPAGAVQDYERAIAKMPGAQSGYIGLGLLEARRGNAQRARELTTRLATIPEKQRVRDPWWAYHTTRIPADDLKWLRQAVRP
jgi:tetratricopeptide (TPR) repeat protein